MWDDPFCIVELQILEIELGGAAVGLYFCIFTGAETEEEGDLDEIRYTLIFGGGRSRLMTRPRGVTFSHFDAGSV